MKNFILLFILVFTSFCYSQKEKLVGNWLLTKVEVGTKIQNPYQIFDYNENGKFIVMGIEVGTWEYSKKKHSIITKSEFDKDFNGEAKILNLSEKELVSIKDDEKAFYQKINKNQITEANATSGLLGTWKLVNKDSDIVQILSFNSPDEFVLIEKDEYTQSTSKGTWIFNKNGKTVILIGFSLEHLKGLNKVINSSGDEISLKNNNTSYSFKKEINQASKIEHLSFSEEDFYNENGDYNYYDDEEKLPWKDFYKMMENLSVVNQLVYNYSVLIEDTEIFKNKTLTANVVVKEDEQTLSIDNIFNGYDSYNLPEDTALPPNNYDEYNKLYPLEGDTFRVVGEEEITTPAGTFNCTIIEALGSFDEKIKIWMITNKPGILAKIIKEKTGNFGHYFKYELQEIK
ncbi:hypothetical protein BX611_1028 [Lutibacter oceani]|uniref:Uncharacterized protein n=1 Tax=Lutibacter oceani TaxID=1853311 RepID=A0A3D9RUT2_9FLAO|nr:hypothetical protein [Lutibacter oceani]REE83733.1 hypothetical protein BX611_1028 [Lutibacter oceani]